MIRMLLHAGVHVLHMMQLMMLHPVVSLSKKGKEEKVSFGIRIRSLNF